MSSHVQPLVVTPRPRKNESLLGFVLRTSEENGYQSPAAILTHAGMSQTEARSLRLPLDKLARLYGRDQEFLAPIAYVQTGNARYGKEFRLNGHKINGRHLAAKRAALCPACVQEAGCIEQFFDLKFAVACPVHRRRVIACCPECRKPFGWYRPGRLICGCGADLSTSPVSGDVDEDTVALLGLIRAKLEGSPPPTQVLEARKFPVRPMVEMKLETLLGLTERFARMATGNSRSAGFDIDGSWRAIRGASRLYADWPRPLFKWLDGYVEKLKKRGTPTQGFYRSLGPIYGSLLKSGLPRGDVKFLETALACYGAKRWSGPLDRRLIRKANGSPERYAGVSAAAKALGVQVSSVRSLIRTGVIPDAGDAAASGRATVDLSKSLPKRVTGGRSLSIRDAAKRIGLPVSVLAALRSGGIFQVRYFGTKLASYHALDVESFRTQLLALSTGSSDAVDAPSAADTISLGAVMRMKLRDPGRKAAVVAALLNGTVPLARGSDESAADLHLYVADLDRLLKSQKGYPFENVPGFNVGRTVSVDT